jgi:hypothetical protein
MYHNLLDGLTLLLSQIVVPFSRWLCWGWTIAWSVGATTLIAQGARATASVSSSILSDLLWIPAIVSDTVNNSLAGLDNILSHLTILVGEDGEGSLNVDCNL